MGLTSLDYSDILRDLAFKICGIILNKTQVNKLLFMCYGIYMANKNEPLFDEHPHAWPYGPVFPRVYKHFDDKKMPIAINSEKAKVFKSNELAVRICEWVIRNYAHLSAYNLSVWSHKEGSPWYKTVYNGNDAVKWNDVIDDNLIKDYFKDVRFQENKTNNEK